MNKKRLIKGFVFIWWILLLFGIVLGFVALRNFYFKNHQSKYELIIEARESTQSIPTHVDSPLQDYLEDGV